MRLARRLFFLYLLLKPYYIFQSGGLQVADAFLLLAGIVLLSAAKFDQNIKSNVIEAIKTNKLLVTFVVIGGAINFVYLTLFPDVKFIMSSVYYIFTLVAVLTFSSIGDRDNFYGTISTIFKFNLIVQLGLFATGIGRNYGERYMGTFNDPNQFGFYILLSFLFVYIIGVLRGKKGNTTLFFLVAFFLIFQSASTGVLLGFAAFSILIAGHYLRHKLHFDYSRLRKFMYILAVLIFITPIIYIATTSILRSQALVVNTGDSVEEQIVFKRLTEKFAKADGDANVSIWEDRGYDKIFYYPEKLIYGAGEGALDRFTKASHNAEIHATFPSILFYYGLIPFIVLMRWIYLKLKDCDIRILFAIMALFIESFTLLNQRQSLFWIIIVLASTYYMYENRDSFTEVRLGRRRDEK